MAGVISLAQSFSSPALWLPHLHMIVPDGASWRNASVVALFARQGWLEEDVAAAMLA